jgi:hypothetical protein
MAQTYKQLGAAAGNGTIGTAANLYTASGTASTSTIISSIVICNTSSSAVTIRLAINTASATYADGKYVIYDAAIAGNDTVSLTLGLTMDPTARYMNFSSSSTALNVSVYGVENS